MNDDAALQALHGTTTATLTWVLLKKGLRKTWMTGARPLAPQPRVVGRAFTLRAPPTTAALARGRAEFDQEKRVEIYKDMQRAGLEEVPLVGLAWRSQGFGFDRRVQGFVNLPGALSTSSGIMLEQVSIG